VNVNSSNINSGKHVTVIIRNTAGVSRQITLPNTRNNRNNANVNIAAGITAFLDFYTVGTTINDVYVSTLGAV
jgi:hypothetical protein